MDGPEDDILQRMEQLRVALESEKGTRLAGIGKDTGSKAVFLDRDGVIIEDGHPTSLKDTPRLIEGSREAIEGLKELGYLIVVATNQGSIGMGRIGHGDMLDVMEFIWKELGSDRPWERAYYSPYHPDSVIDRYRSDEMDRKPFPGMLLRAANDLDIDLTSSIMVGDHLKDIWAAHAAGCKGILVCTGRGDKQLRKMLEEGIGPDDPRYPDIIVQDLFHAYLAIKEGAF